MTAAATPDIRLELAEQLAEAPLAYQATTDGIPTLWIAKERVHDALLRLKSGVPRPYNFLYDLTAIDERERTQRDGQPESDFTVVYLLLSFDRKQYLRVKVPLTGDRPTTRTCDRSPSSLAPDISGFRNCPIPEPGIDCGIWMQPYVWEGSMCG